ncbi:bifunctional diaminohydroxyphosphoribosylaminopyrimidine deaminase/5-amino-6-(5-phosphoribosylamino)uracil reductase RibD [Thalassobacter stenotrophicus]|nr:bifunctional diaminohydroxyphosphoribosylaminopyrimidine deaminase/5-amino-6-(5-phosphoribosylamino)uracil reductase RibD [Thalassobacter stenotrophicus]
MRAALALARRGLGRVWPNPSVGCVIVRDGRVIGRARTADGGRPHAETRALAMGDARGATAYVTLEPCAHTGQTGPCAMALVAAGVARVVIAQTDPDPRVDGGGIRILQDAGIEVTTGVCTDEAALLQRGFTTRITQNRPMVTLKLASTLDGRIATASGESQWITGPAARAHVHAQRAAHDAVMVGAGTLRADDPQLTVRGMGDVPQPVRVVVSRRLDLPPTARMFHDRAAPVWLCHGAAAPAPLRDQFGDARLIECGQDGRNLDPSAVLHALGDAGLTRVYCEGGGALAASLLAAGLVDEIHLYLAGKIIGAEGTPSIAAMGLSKLAQAPQFALSAHRQIGADALQVWRPTA